MPKRGGVRRTGITGGKEATSEQSEYVDVIHRLIKIGMDELSVGRSSPTSKEPIFIRLTHDLNTSKRIAADSMHRNNRSEALIMMTRAGCKLVVIQSPAEEVKSERPAWRNFIKQSNGVFTRW
jgi:hypothetical protein